MACASTPTVAASSPTTSPPRRSVAIEDCVIDGADVHGTCPEALPFHRCNRGNYGMVWGHFFTARPATATAATAASGGRGTSIPIAKDLVVWKVYNLVEIPEEEPLVNYHRSDNDSNCEDESEEITVQDLVGVVADIPDVCLDMARQQHK